MSSRIKDEDCSCIDVEWYGIDNKGNIAVFCSGGIGNLPEFVCENAERVDYIMEYFDKCEKYSKCIMRYETDGIAKEVAEDYSRRGLFYYDCYDPFRKRLSHERRFYTKLSYPESPLKYNDLPDEIKNLLKHNFLDIPDFSETDNVHIRHAYQNFKKPVRRVSFDLDDTIFVSPENVRTEKNLKFPLNKIFKERLRLGTKSLFKYISEHGELWIYTTSYRSEKYIRNLFRCYGIKIDNIVNGYRHQREVQGNKTEIMPSKYPSRYHIDLHVDDEIHVAQNGERYGFRVFIVGEQDNEWDKKIIEIMKKSYF